MHARCFIFEPVKFEQTITRQHVLLRRKNRIDETSVTIILCLHFLITHRIFFGNVDYFQ
jgi:hypothetical protein